VHALSKCFKQKCFFPPHHEIFIGELCTPFRKERMSVPHKETHLNIGEIVKVVEEEFKTVCVILKQQMVS